MQREAALSLAVALAAVTVFARPARAQDAPQPELVASTEARTPDEERAGFRLPPGFEAQLVAAEPDIHKPMNLAFDDRGRLWVTSTLEYPYPAVAGTTPRDEVLILDDFAPDGRARSITRFAGGLNIPIGVLPLTPDQALVHSIPAIHRLADDDGDGFADRDEVAYATYGSRDTHGMTNAFTQGFDGWVYACHGFSNDSEVEGSDDQPIAMNSGNTYRIRADGSHAEYFTHGQVNPFGLAFDSLGNLFSCDCHTRPIYQLLRGAWYDSFGKPHDGLGYGPEMMSHSHGSTGIAGIVVYEADRLPEEYRHTVFVGNVVTSRINHDRLERHGSTLLAIEQPDFLVSEDPWFRPVDIELGPDGALYVADFYNRIIGHYEVPLAHPGRDRTRGRIWRIVYRGDDGEIGTPAPRTDFAAATADELSEDLGHPNLAVRLRATNVLARRGDDANEAARAAFDDPEDPKRRAHGLWTLARLGAAGADDLARAAKDEDALVRVHAFRVLAERPDWDSTLHDLVVAGLADDDAFARRAAADALGRHPSRENIRPLLDLRHGVPADDTHLLHVARMALRDQLVDASAWEALSDLELSEADDRALADVAPGVHTPEAAAFLLAHLRQYPVHGGDLDRFARHVARFGTDATVAEFLTFARADRPDDLVRQAALLRAFHRGRQERGAPLTDAGQEWAIALVPTLIGSSEAGEAQAGIELAGALRLAEAADALAAVATNRDLPEDRRAPALAALVGLGAGDPVGVLGGILRDAAEPATLRDRAAQGLAGLNRPESRVALLEVLPVAPGPLQVTIAAGLAAARDGAEALLEAVASGKASARLLRERAVEVRLTQAGVPDLDARLDALLAGLPAADAQILEMLAARRAAFGKADPDAERGHAVFQKTCAACHQIGGEGAKVGPQLDGVGLRGPERLIEDILDPNRNVDQAFRSTTLALDDGRVVSGLLLREEGEVLVLADAEGKEVRVPLDQVADRKVDPISPMPANFAEQVPEADFFDLLAYLLSRRDDTLPVEAPPGP